MNDEPPLHWDATLRMPTGKAPERVIRNPAEATALAHCIIHHAFPGVPGGQRSFHPIKCPFCDVSDAERIRMSTDWWSWAFLPDGVRDVVSEFMALPQEDRDELVRKAQGFGQLGFGDFSSPKRGR